MPPPGFVKCTLGRGEDGDPAVFFSKMKGYAHADMCELPELTKPAILDCLRHQHVQQCSQLQPAGRRLGHQPGDDNAADLQ